MGNTAAAIAFRDVTGFHFSDTHPDGSAGDSQAVITPATATAGPPLRN
jgi:hypothetical protein